MISKEKILKVVLEAVDDFNQARIDQKPLEKKLDRTLIGRDGALDSLGLVSLIVAVEAKIQEEFDVIIVLASEQAMSLAHSPFKNLGNLVEYIFSLVNAPSKKD